MGPIDDHHASLGGNAGLLGAPTGPELGTPDGIGRFRPYPVRRAQLGTGRCAQEARVPAQ